MGHREVERVETERWRWLQAIASEQGPRDPVTRLVLMTLSLHMNQKGDNAWPAQSTLAKRSGLSERCVRTHLHLADAAGWLSVYDKRPAGKGWRRREYVATVPADLLEELKAHPWEQDSDWRRAEQDAAPAPEGAESGASPHPERAARSSAPVTVTPSDRAERGAHRAAPGADGAAPEALRAAPDDRIVRHHVPTTLPSDCSMTQSGDSSSEGALARTATRLVGMRRVEPRKPEAATEAEIRRALALLPESRDQEVAERGLSGRTTAEAVRQVRGSLEQARRATA